MKLVSVWNAQFAWKALSALKVSPAFSYRMMTYGDQFDAEIAKAEKFRQQCLYAAAGKEPGTDVKIEPDTQEMLDYLAKFNDALSVDSVLEVFDMDIPGLLAEISARPENLLSKDDLQALKPIFEKKPKPEKPTE